MTIKLILIPAVLAGLLTGCQTMADVQPGDGKAVTITGKGYEEVYNAAWKVADEHFDIQEQSRATGVIKAERTVTMFGNGAWVGIYIVPPAPGAASYRVEVVSRKKATANIGEQSWERKTLRDIQDVLDGKPMR